VYRRKLRPGCGSGAWRAAVGPPAEARTVRLLSGVDSLRSVGEPVASLMPALIAACRGVVCDRGRPEEEAWACWRSSRGSASRSRS
jgi:hypothetical protein